MNEHLKLKPFSKSTIQYIIIHTDENNDIRNLFGTPKTYSVLRQLAKFPRDFVQFKNPSLFFRASISVAEINPRLNVLFLDDNDIEVTLAKDNSYVSLFGLDERPTVYFIDANTKKLKKIIEVVNNIKHNHFYFALYNDNGEISLDDNVKKNKFIDNYDLIELLKRDFSEFKSVLSNDTGLMMNIDNSPNESLFIDFNPLINNQLTLEQISTKVWKSSPPKVETLKDHTQRETILLNSVVKLDEQHIKAINELPILVAVFPFYNPVLKSELKKIDQLSDQKFIELFYSLEQDSNYNQFLIDKDNSIDPKTQMIGTNILKEFIGPKMLSLDSISHLHSSFTFSPTIRFPLKGKSLFKELSFFNPSSSNFKSKKSNKQKINTILKFGKKLSEITVSKETRNYLKNRNGQILAISDLPIEFLTLDGVPLSYSHDICRIQESNTQGFLNNYSAHNKLEYYVSDKTISNILVILSGDAESSNNHEFTTIYQMVISESKNHGFKYSFCNSIKDIKLSIDKYKPEILIFDCHGEIDEKLKTTYLKINKEKLYGSDIIKYGLSAPIVYLSCCNTNPNFGYLNKIHDAFFEVGALTVTGTFLPISIAKGTACYIRMIYLLKEAIDKKFFNNWLEFISQSIRTSVIHDFIMKAKKNENQDYTDFELKKLASVIDDIRDFSKRRKIFKSLMNGGINISSDLKLNIFDTESEFLMYSHYGRADLIKMKRL